MILSKKMLQCFRNRMLFGMFIAIIALLAFPPLRVMAWIVGPWVAVPVGFVSAYFLGWWGEKIA